MPNLSTDITAGNITIGGTLTVTGTINGLTILSGTADPSAGGGVAATQPAVYYRTGTDQVWLNNGAGDTAWTRLATGVDTALLAPLASPTFTGTVNAAAITASGAVSGATLKATTDGTAAAPALNIADRGGLYGASTPSMNIASPLGTVNQTLTSGALTANGLVSSTTSSHSRNITSESTPFAAVTTVLAFAGSNQPVTLTGGAVTNAAAPSISGGIAGDIIELRGITGAGTYVIQDKGTLPSSGLTLVTATVTIGLGDVVRLRCTAASTWVQIVPVVNNI